MESSYLRGEEFSGRAFISFFPNQTNSFSKEQIDSCTNQGYEAFLWISLTVVAMSIPVGILGNLMVFTSVYSNKSLRSANNALLMNLAVADLMTCTLSAPISWIVILMAIMVGHAEWEIPTVMCSIQVYFHIMSYSVQLVTLALIGLERHAAITHPFEKKKKRKRVTIGIITAWILGFLFGIISVMFLSSTPIFVLCSCSGNQDRSYFGSAHLYILTPLGISCFIVVVYYYFKIYLIVRKHVKERDVTLGGGYNEDNQPGRRFGFLDIFLRPPFCQNCRANRVAPTNGLPTLETQQATHTEEEEPVHSTKSADNTPPPLPRTQTHGSITVGNIGSSQESMLRQVSEKSSFVSRLEISSCLSSSSNADRTEGMTVVDERIIRNRPFTSDSISRDRLKKQTLCYDLNNCANTAASNARVKLNSENVGFVLSGNQLDIYDQSYEIYSPSCSSSPSGVQEISKDIFLKTQSKIVVEPYSVSGHVYNSSRSLPNLSDNQEGLRRTYREDQTIVEQHNSCDTKTKKVEQHDFQLDSDKNTLNIGVLPATEGTYLSADINMSNETEAAGKDENAATESQIQDVAASANVVGSVCVFNPKNRERGRRSVEAGTAKRAAYIIIVFSLCWLPLFVVTLLNASSLTVTSLYMLVFFSCTVLFSSAVNPIVYTVVNRSFRQEFKKILRKPTKCLPG